MGVVPLQFLEGDTPSGLGLTGKETFTISGLGKKRTDRVSITATGDDGKETAFEARVRIDTPKEQEYFVNGGILHYVLRQLASA
jgi:aconitate hydratase